MSGVYEGPDGQELYGDGREVELTELVEYPTTEQWKSLFDLVKCLRLTDAEL